MEHAAPIGLVPGDNLPFAYVNWEALQSVVVSPTGAQFSVIPVEIGANQIPIPIGDGVIVSCGPFACYEGPMAPEITIADSGVCNDWEADIMLDVGFVDNTAMNLDPDPDTDGDQDGDAPFGRRDRRRLGLHLQHRPGDHPPLRQRPHGRGEGRRDVPDDGTQRQRRRPGPAASREYRLIRQGHDNTSSTSSMSQPVVPRPTERWACDSTGPSRSRTPTPDSDYNPANLTVTMPDECFRISANGANYLADYTIELAAVGSAVSWGAVDWSKVFEEEEDNPFDGLTCEPMMVAAADEVDVCALFEDEVDRALEAGWGGAEGYLDAAADATPSFVVDVTTATANVPSTGELNWEAESKSGPRQFGTIWYDIDGSGSPTDDLYNDTDDGAGTPECSRGRKGDHSEP